MRPLRVHYQGLCYRASILNVHLVYAKNHKKPVSVNKTNKKDTNALPS